MKLIQFTQRASTVNPANALRLSRTFVETGEEHCPIAGIWLRLAENDAAADDPHLARPAMRNSFCWRAFHFGLTTLRYSTR